jgi:hypothetical protein
MSISHTPGQRLRTTGRKKILCGKKRQAVATNDNLEGLTFYALLFSRIFIILSVYNPKTVL